MKRRLAVVTAAAGLVLADASIVTLALPELLRALDTSVEGVAAVIAVYTLVLAAALLPAERLMRRTGPAPLGAAGFLLFGVASALCAEADTLAFLLGARALQAVGGAAGLVAGFALIDGGAPAGRRHWLGAAVLSSAIGPALGGALTEAFDWRAIFVVQIPVAAFAAVAALTASRGALAPSAPPAPASAPAYEHPAASRRSRALDAVALALVSAALTAVLFLLVLLLVAGWAISPLAAAATVTVLPLAALLGSRVGGAPRPRAAAGSLLVGAGVLALAWLPDANVAWTFVPQALAGIGMGMALPAFAGELLPERTPHDAAWLLTIRHAGIAVVLIAVAPLIASQLDKTTERATERGVALVLDARLPPADKLALAPELLSGVDAEQPRAGLDAQLDANRGDYEGEERATYDALAARADETIVTAVGEAFRWPFVIAGAFAVAAALALVAGGIGGRRGAAPGGRPGEEPGGRRGAQQADRERFDAPAPAAPAAGVRRSGVGAGAAVLALAVVAVVAVPAAYALAHREIAPEPGAIADPCDDRDLPDSGGITGFLQDRALEVVDAGACRLGVSREELVLALADEESARRFQQRHGVDPRSVTSLVGGLLNP